MAPNTPTSTLPGSFAGRVCADRAGQRWCIALGAAVCACSAAPAAPARAPAPLATAVPVEGPPELEQRVEWALLPPLQVQGEALAPTTLRERMAALKVTGLSIAVFDEAGQVWAKGYGLADAETREAVTVRTLFQAGSISKSVNALAVLLAASRGAFSLDVPVNDLLSEWKLPDSPLTKQTPVTLRRLLSHTAGTTVHGFPGYPTGAPLPTLLEVLDGAPPANTPPVRVELLPGAQFRYSGGGTTITQLVLVDAFSQPYPVILEQQVLGPLGMSSSTFQQPLSGDWLRRAAAGHGADGAVIPTRRHVYPEMAAAGLWTTPTDLVTFFRELALARAGRSKAIPAELAREMTDLIDPEARVGLGVFLYERRGAPLFGHDGVDEGFNASAVSSLDGVHGVVMMANSASGMRLFPDIERTVFAALGWAGADAPVERVALSAEQRSAWLGDYTMQPGLPFTIRAEGERLTLARALDEPVELVAVSPTRSFQRQTGFGHTLHADGIDIDGPRGSIGAARRAAPGEKLPLLELAAGRTESALTAWRERLDADPGGIGAGVGMCLGYGHELLEKGANSSAIILFGACARVLPAFPAISAGLGAAHAAAGDAQAAAQAYTEALHKLDGATWLSAPQRENLRRRVQQGLDELQARAH
jgi:CubicO group peptidase (beta-lactamase class C family)